MLWILHADNFILPKHVNRIVIVVMIVFVLMLLIEWLVQFLPLSLNYNATQYERRVEGLFYILSQLASHLFQWLFYAQWLKR